MTTKPVTYRQYGFYGKRSPAEQAADVFAAYRENAPGTPLSIMVGQNVYDLIRPVVPSGTDVTIIEAQGTMMVRLRDGR